MRDRLNPYTISTDCVTKEFALDKNGDVSLYFRGYYNLMMKYMGVDGTMYQCDEGSPDTFTCMATMHGGSHRSPIHVFDTDYESYEIMYECADVLGGLMKNEMFSVTTREPEASPETMARVEMVVRERLPQYDLETSWGLTKPKQGSDCSYDWQFDTTAKSSE